MSADFAFTPLLALDFVCRVLGIEHDIVKEPPASSGVFLQPSTIVPGDFKIVITVPVSAMQMNQLTNNFNVWFFPASNQLTLTRPTLK